MSRTDYQGIAGGVNIWEESISDTGVNYGVGFGGGDLERALNDGYTARSILDYLDRYYTGVVPSGVRSQLESRAASEGQPGITDKRDHPLWQLAASQLVAAVNKGRHSASHVIGQGWMDSVIRNAYGENADVSINAIQNINDVHDLIYNVGKNHWDHERSSYSDFPINGYSPHSTDFNGYVPGKTGVWHGVDQSGDGTIPSGPTVPQLPPNTSWVWADDPNPNVFNRADVKHWYQTVFEETGDIETGTVSVVDLMQMRTSMLDAINNGTLVAGEGVKAMLEKTRSEPHDPGALGNKKALDMDQLTSWWGYYDDTQYSQTNEETSFKHVDRLASLAAGFDDYDIWQYMRAHPEKFKNADGTDNPNAQLTFEKVEEKLNARGRVYLHRAATHSDPRWSHYMPQLAKMPVWVKIQDHINTLHGHDHITWVDWDDMETLYNFIQTHVNTSPDYDSVYDIVDDDDYRSVIGAANVPGATGDIGTWTPGEYWSQWGVSGPPDRDQGDGLNKPDLTFPQKMVAEAGLHSADAGTYRSKLESLENKFLDELYTVDPQTGRKGYLDAPDHWGLDIMRLDADGEAFDWKDTDNTDIDEWYATVAKGDLEDIDWAFYRDSAEYQKAHEALGFDMDKNERYADDHPDESKRGKYKNRKIDTVQEIRAANIWVHGQHTIMPADEDAALDWERYVPEFNSATEPKYTPVDLSITGYTPEPRRPVTDVKTQITAPTINVPTDPIRVPGQLKNWDTLNPAPGGDIK